jgi:hypothetical protein
MTNNYKHSGATGDIIFSLPTIKKMGGGNLYIVPYDLQRAESISELIRVQPYINRVVVTETPPHDCIDLDKFRSFAGYHSNLVEAHFKGQNLEPDNWKDGWIELPEVTEPPVWFSNYSVINRTTNYADPNFDWGEEVEYLFTISDTCFFIGYKDEYKLFQEKFKTKAQFFECDFLRAAYLIKYANMFTGCYSAMSTIAMGLGIDYRIEQAPGHTCSSLLMPREVIVNA